MKRCPMCGRPLAEEVDLLAELITVLGDYPGGITTIPLAKLVRRRLADVLAALEGLERAGFVERLEGVPGRNWRARPWRLAEKGPGKTREKPQTIAGRGRG